MYVACIYVHGPAYVQLSPGNFAFILCIYKRGDEKQREKVRVSEKNLVGGRNRAITLDNIPDVICWNNKLAKTTKILLRKEFSKFNP